MEQVDAELFEEQNVHQVYKKIAAHFNETRYKPWPVVEQFLIDLPAGSIGIDVGCGNGKYLAVNQKVSLLGSDVYARLYFTILNRCKELLETAHKKKVSHHLVVANALSLPYRSGTVGFSFDSNFERRVDALREIARTLRPGGVALIFVWAFEQQAGKRVYPEQDAQVSWELKNGAVENRYYHFFRKNELEGLLDGVSKVYPVRIVRSGHDKGNWFVEFIKESGSCV